MKKTTLIAFATTFIFTSNAWAMLSTGFNNIQQVQKCIDVGNGRQDCGGGTTTIWQPPPVTNDPVLPANPDVPLIDGWGDSITTRYPIDDDVTLIKLPSSDSSTTATVSSCPSGMTKSSDGCCCVNN